MEWTLAPDVKLRLKKLLKANLFPHIRVSQITAMRGRGSSSKAVARIWGLPRPWQMVLKIKPQYIIEVIAERFDKLSRRDQDQTLIHELMHIPKTFSGALVAHRRGFHKRVYDHFTAWRQRSR